MATPVHNSKIEIVRGWRSGSVGKVIACHEVRILEPTTMKGRYGRLPIIPGVEDKSRGSPEQAG